MHIKAVWCAVSASSASSRVGYLNAKRMAEDATATLETAREQLVALTSHPSGSGAGTGQREP